MPLKIVVISVVLLDRCNRSELTHWELELCPPATITSIGCRETYSSTMRQQVAKMMTLKLDWIICRGAWML